jgi:RHS repeat-associated protein
MMLSRREGVRRWTVARRRRVRARFLAVSAVVATWTLILNLVVANAVPAYVAPPPKPDPGPAVTGLTAIPHKTLNSPSATKTSFTPSKTTWPKAASGTLTLAEPRSIAHAAGAKGSAAGTPVWAQAMAGTSGAYQGPSSLGVRVQPQSLSNNLGISGVVWALSSGASTTDGSVRVGLDYSAFAQAVGGNYASRLHLVELPACALTTPQLAKCRVQTPLASTNDLKGGSVSALVTLRGQGASAGAAQIPGASAQQRGASDSSRTYSDAVAGGSAVIEPASTTGPATVIAATDSTGQEGGGGGNYAATQLSSAGSWSAGGSSGDYAYTYSVATPGASTSLAPDASLSYDSGSVDGKTANTQAQSSWVGDGWSTQDSYIEQSYIPCDDTPEGSAGTVTTTDECYDGDVLTLSLNGSSTSLVKNDSGDTWRLQDDNGATVSHVTNSNNGTGTYNTDYWVITERDGTAYYFGRNELPGWTSGKATTNSVDYERVYAAHATDPCYNATASSSYCVRAYKWHLDYVTTLQGAAMSYYYTQALNSYGAYGGASNGASNVSYVRDSYLNHVDYGYTTSTGPYGIVPDKVVYTPGVRCVAGSAICGTAETSGSSGNESHYPDVPYDLVCASGATCTAYAPSFFSTVRLTAITTEQYSTASSGYVPVDTYALTQTMPDTGDKTSATLWLQSVQRTGNDTSGGGASTPLPATLVQFNGSALENRVNTSVYPGLFRYRITQVINETGGSIGVTYTLPTACSTSVAPSANTASCFPVYWTPYNYNSPILDWFYRYAVQEVLETDTTGGGTATTGGSSIKETDYSYSGAAWHYDDDETVKPKYRTYGQWRGYQQVTTTTGNGSDPKTEQVTSYYQGMDGDYLSSTSTRSVSLTDSQHGTHTDSNQLQGKVLESTSYLGYGGGIDHTTINSYWVSDATATRTRTGLPALTANMTGTAEQWTQQRLTDGGTISYRVNETDTTYDATTTHTNFGLPLYTYTHTVPVNAAYDRCSATTYAAGNTSLNLIGLASGAETDSVACSGFTEGSVSSVPSGYNTLGAPTSVTRPGQVVSATQTFYDDPTFSGTQPAAPTGGQVTMTRVATDYTSGAYKWRTTAENTYDAYGRIASVTDGRGNTTTTSYTVNAAYLTTGTTVTAPTVGGIAHVTSSTLDPERGLTLTATDVNGVITTKQYDSMGRVTSVWLDSRPTTSLANYTYAYTISNTALSGVVTEQLNDNSGYLTSVTIEDSLGRDRQTQTYTPQGGRLITDEIYDSRGWVSKKNNAYWDPSTTPVIGTTLYTVPDNGSFHQDDYVYDGLGRVIYDQSEYKGGIVSTTTTVYTGDATTVIPPTGGVTKTTKTDPLGRTSEVDAYSAAPTLTTPSNTNTGLFYISGGTAVATTYGYDGHGKQSTTTDANGDVWTTGYDLAGEVVSKFDPTAGTSSMAYDGDGNLTQTEDSRNDYVSYTYDALNRKTAQYAAASNAQVAYSSTTSPGNETASWIYDNANNAVASMTYPIGHATTETSYSGGYPYVTQYLGFNIFGESLGESVTIPSAAQGTVLGKTWKITHSYTSLVGLHNGDTYLLGGGLPAESVGYSYNNDGQLYGVATTAYTYVQQTSYTAYNQVSAVVYGPTSSDATVGYTYDDHTGWLTDELVTRSTTAPASVDNTAYAYDLSGNITRQTETRLGSSSTAETQCFAYNYDNLDRLTAAWTATDGCATAPTSSAHSMVGDGIAGGTYWDSWTYDNVGNRQSQTQHAVTSGASDVTTNYTYNGNSANQPNTLTSTTGGANGSTSYSYDTAGNTTTRVTSLGTQNLTWNNAGQLTRVANTTTSTASNYIYDADGSLLLQIDPTTTTLYLGSEQFTLNNSTSAISGVRYYSAPGGGTIVRTGTGTNYSFELGDQHGTNTLYLDSTAQIPTWRQYDPYGNTRGTAATWLDNRTFLNTPTDTSTGLTDVGARYYDPTVGRFASLDPVFEADDTLALNGYGYTDDNPVTQADPSGQDAGEYGTGVGGTAPDCDSSCQAQEVTPADMAGSGDGCLAHGYAGPCALPPGHHGGKGTAGSGTPAGSGDTGCFHSFSNFWGCTEHVASDAAPYVAVTLVVVGGAICIAATDGACALVGLSSLTSVEGATVAAGACAETICGGLTLGGAGILFGAPGGDEPVIGGGSGANMSAENEVLGTAIQQTKPMSCFAACGEMLTNGAATQDSLIAKLDPSGIMGASSGDTARALGGGWRGGSVAGVDNRDQVFSALNTTGAWGAMMRGAKGGYHMVVVDGLDSSGSVLIRDPHNGSSYTTPYSEFINVWTGEAVFNP